MTESRYTLLRELSVPHTSEERRELLRKVTDALSQTARAPTDEEMSALDGVLSQAAQEYSLQVRTEFARLVAASVTRFCESAEQFAMDDIAVAEPVLRHSRALSEDALIRVVAQKSQQHMLAVTKRSEVSAAVSHALVERGDDHVVTSLLANTRADIADHTYDMVAQRAESSPALQGPLVRRQGVPVDVLHGLYQKVEVSLRREILQKFDRVSPEDLEKAFKRSRARLDGSFASMPDDISQARKRLAAMQDTGQLKPAALAGLLREGQSARTLFKLAFSRLTDADFDTIDRAVEGGDIDTVALLCRGAQFDRGLFVAIAVALDPKSQGLSAADKFGAMYESVPVEAARRALRFWKVRAA